MIMLSVVFIIEDFRTINSILNNIRSVRLSIFFSQHKSILSNGLMRRRMTLSLMTLQR